MIRVFVWNADGQSSVYGHTSMTVRAEHISWWPITPPSYSLIPPDFESYAEILSLDAEIKKERCAPHHTVTLSGLDEGAILRWWRAGLKSQVWTSTWHALSLNCATVVAAALEVGGVDDDRLLPFWYYFQTRRNLYWKPAHVLHLAREIKKSMLSRDRRYAVAGVDPRL